MFAGAEGLLVGLVTKLLWEHLLEQLGGLADLIADSLIIAADGVQTDVPAVILCQRGLLGLLAPEAVDQVSLLADHRQQGVFAHDVLDLALVDKTLGQLLRGILCFHHGYGSFLFVVLCWLKFVNCIWGSCLNNCIIKSKQTKSKIAVWNVDMFQT